MQTILRRVALDEVRQLRLAQRGGTFLGLLGRKQPGNRARNDNTKMVRISSSLSRDPRLSPRNVRVSLDRRAACDTHGERWRPPARGLRRRCYL